MVQVHRREQGGLRMSFFDRENETLEPYREYGAYALYRIDALNRTAGIEFFFDYGKEEAAYYGGIVEEALRTAFEGLDMHKVYVNVIRDDIHLFQVLSGFNFIMEAIHREQYDDGRKHDVVFMTVLRGEWEKQGVRLGYGYGAYGIEPSHGIKAGGVFGCL